MEIQVSSYMIWRVVHDAGFTWDKDRSWCETGTAVRKRKSATAIPARES
jgi:hypothetical protein